MAYAKATAGYELGDLAARWFRHSDRQAVVVLDETAELKKGDRTVGVARQHAGCTGQVENCVSAP